MKNLDNIKYDNINYNKFRIRLKEILENEQLKSVGIEYNLLGFTEYKYPFETITIGKGEKEIFIVGGTHGSEVIGVDFILQLMESISDFEEFNPNLYKIIFVPIQNPEGFDISSSTYKDISDDDFQKKSFEYYERYRIDSLTSIAFDSLNKLINNFLKRGKVLVAQDLLNEIKTFINNDTNWLKLCDERGLPQLNILNKYINNIENVNDFSELKNYLINISNTTLNTLTNKDYKNKYCKVFLNEFKQGFDNALIWKEIDKKNKEKLYQLMFKDDNFKNIENKDLKNQVEKLYGENDLPKGSQVAYDANGNGINLNANNKLNPGIELLYNNFIVYGSTTKDNIVRYFKGPIGAPTKDINNFTYELENIYLYNLLNESYNKGKYLSAFLYHGTGGMIFYKPNENLMDETTLLYIIKL